LRNVGTSYKVEKSMRNRGLDRSPVLPHCGNKEAMHPKDHRDFLVKEKSGKLGLGSETDKSSASNCQTGLKKAVKTKC